MGFSLKLASETAITLPGIASSPATAATQAGAADAGLFAELFAGQLGAGGTADGSELTTALGLADSKPANLLPGNEPLPEGVGKKARRSPAANPQPGADEALLAQMQAAALQNGQRPVLRGEPAEAAMPGRKVGRPSTAETAVSELEQAAASSARQARARQRGQEGAGDAAYPATQSVAGDSEAARQAAVQRLMALPAADRQAVLSQAQQLTDKEALQQLMALSPRDRQAVMAQVTAAANQPVAQTRAAASQAAFQDAALPAAGLATTTLQSAPASALPRDRECVAPVGTAGRQGQAGRVAVGCTFDVPTRGHAG